MGYSWGTVGKRLGYNLGYKWGIEVPQMGELVAFKKCNETVREELKVQLQKKSTVKSTSPIRQKKCMEGLHFMIACQLANVVPERSGGLVQLTIRSREGCRVKLGEKRGKLGF